GGPAMATLRTLVAAAGSAALLLFASVAPAGAQLVVNRGINPWTGHVYRDLVVRNPWNGRVWTASPVHNPWTGGAVGGGAVHLPGPGRPGGGGAVPPRGPSRPAPGGGERTPGPGRTRWVVTGGRRW